MVTNTEIGQYIITTGNPTDGFVYIGPFNTYQRALDYATKHCARCSAWWIGEMIAPNKREGRLP